MSANELPNRLTQASRKKIIVKMMFGGNRFTQILTGLGIIFLIGSCGIFPIATLTGKDIAEVTPEPMPTVAPTTAPAVTGTPVVYPVRVQFAIGSYGTVIYGKENAKYLLWAKAGQVFKVALVSDGTGHTSLYSVGGQPLYEQAGAGMVVTTTLAATGDQVLTVASTGAYTMGVEIR